MSGRSGGGGGHGGEFDSLRVSRSGGPDSDTDSDSDSDSYLRVRSHLFETIQMELLL